MFSWVHVKRKSAVELLEETKGFYVKTERVLDSKQELPHCDRFQVRSPMPGFPARSRDPAGLGHSTSHLSRSVSYKEMNQSMTEAPPKRQHSTKGAETHEKHQLAIRKHLPIPLSMAAVKRFLSRPEDVSQVKRVSPLPSSSSRPSESFDSKKSSYQSLTGFSLTDQNFQGTVGATATSKRFSAGDPVPCTCHQVNRAPPQLPSRMNHSLITPPPLPPKSPGLRLRQVSQPGLRAERQTQPPPQRGSYPPNLRKQGNPAKDHQDHMTRTAPRLTSTYLYKSLPDLNPATKSSRKLRAASTEVSCSECGSSDISRSPTSSSTSPTAESSAGSKIIIRRKSQYTAGDRATSDYASRSPSFKYETGSLLHTSRTYWYSQAEEKRTKKRPIIRSKSDIGHSVFREPAPTSNLVGNQVPSDLDKFFQSCGVQNTELVNASGRSTPVYFSSISSVDSADRKPTTELDADDLAAALQRRLLGSQPGLGEPSIVERNARIIKWIINCRKAAAASSPPSAALPVLTKKISKHLSRSFKDRQDCTQTTYYGQSTRL